MTQNFIFTKKLLQFPNLKKKRILEYYKEVWLVELVIIYCAVLWLPFSVIKS